MSEKNLNLPDQETVLNNEDALLRGLIEAGNYRSDTTNYRKINVKRDGRVLFSFTIRPLSEEDEKACADQATKKYPNPQGRKLPPISGDTDWAKFRSFKIYRATIDQDRAKIWDNKTLQNHFNVLHGVDMIDEVLDPGTKTAICSILNDISGGSVSEDDLLDSEPATLEEYAKN